MDANARDTLRYYFSFRSPYAWLATERLEAELGGLGLTIEPIAIYPTPETFPNDPSALPNKVRYFVQDVSRLAREYGLTLKFPSVADPDWSLSHAAFIAAAREGCDWRRFALAVFRKRWSEGADLGSDEVIAEAADAAALDRDAILAAAHDDDLRARAGQAWARAMEEDKIFGVPSFVYRDKLYWGQDRMRFVRAAVERKRGIAN